MKKITAILILATLFAGCGKKEKKRKELDEKIERQHTKMEIMAERKRIHILRDITKTLSVTNNASHIAVLEEILHEALRDEITIKEEMAVLSKLREQKALLSPDTSPPTKEKWEKVLSITLPNSLETIRADILITTPTETWGIKLESFKNEIRKWTGVDVPFHIEKDLAMLEVKGWEGNIDNACWYRGGGPTALESLRIIAEISNFKCTIANDGIHLELIKDSASD